MVSLTALALNVSILVKQDGASYCEVLSRSLAWDPKGAYALDADEPFTTSSRKIIGYLKDAELGRAESLSRHRLQVDKHDLVPAWVLGQVSRVRKKALSEYLGSVSLHLKEPASVPMLLYRLHICRLAEMEMSQTRRRTGDKLWETIRRDLNWIGSQLRPVAHKRLGTAIGITQVSPYWTVEDRKTLEEYRSSHPKGPEVRPLIAQAYAIGMHYGPIKTLYSDQATDPLEPKPQLAQEIIRDLLRDRPADPLGLYYAGSLSYKFGRTDPALKYLRAALETGELPPLYEKAARTFVASPSHRALRPYVPY